MVDATAKTVNDVLALAGIDPAHLSVTACEKVDACTLRSQEGNAVQEKRFEDLEGLSAYVNQWIGAHPNLAKNKLPERSRLFRSVNPKFILFDSDKFQGSEGFLYRLRDEWKLVRDGGDAQNIPVLSEDLLKLAHAVLPPKEFEQATAILVKDPKPLTALLEALAGKTWKDLGLQASPTEFGNRNYPFEVPEDPKLPSFLSPFHAVNLTWHPEVKVPWSDPYLQVEWRGFLTEAGIKIQREKSSGDPWNAKYYFKGLLLMDSERIGDQVRVRVYSPLERLEQETVLSVPPKIPVQVLEPGKDGNPYSLKVHGLTFRVFAYFPDSAALEDKTKELQALGRALQKIPPAMLRPLSQGVGKEEPVQILLSSKELAFEVGWVKPEAFRITGANYNLVENRAWIPLTYDRIGRIDRGSTILHEIGGHAYSDFRVPQDGVEELADPSRSALRDYYAWKLAQIFSPSELATYDALSRKYLDWLGAGDRDENAGKKLATELQPFRKRMLERFLSEYAAEGGEGIGPHLKAPREFVAEVLAHFFLGLEDHDKWAAEVKREPLLRLIGMDYLFQQYGVETIGRISRGEVYSAQTFSTLLGIRVDGVDAEAYDSAGVSLDGKIRRGFVFPLQAGLQGLSLQSNDKSLSGLGGGVGIKLGYRWNNFGVGGLFEFAAYKMDASSLGLKDRLNVGTLDLGLWTQFSLQNKGFGIFFEPTLGYRNTSLDKAPGGGASFWMGANAGLGVLSNSLGLVLQNKWNLSQPGQWQNYGLMLYFDPAIFFRHAGVFD
ncbi:MAG: hypothetical protein U1F66_04025 [bacterium]